MLDFPISPLMVAPKSKVLERGYINVYSNLTPQERRALTFNRQYKQRHPCWDNTTIQLCQEFEVFLKNHQAKSTQPPVILDAGCGHGNYVVDEFRTQIGWACGVDVDPSETSRNICLDEIRYARLEHIPYPDASFDAVLSLWVIEHLDHPVEVFQEIKRVLKPGGWFIFCTPNHHSILVRLKRLLRFGMSRYLNRRVYGRQETDVFATHYRANDLGTLGRLLNHVGFVSSSLKLNYDPGYTAFNLPTWWLTNQFENTLGRLTPSLTRMHIVGHALASS